MIFFCEVRINLDGHLLENYLATFSLADEHRFSDHCLAHQLVVVHFFHEAQTTFSPRLSEIATNHTHGIHDDAIFIFRKAWLTQQGMITLAKSRDFDIELSFTDGP